MRRGRGAAGGAIALVALAAAVATAVLVDRRGVIRYTHIAEGAYAETEAMIRRLLDEQG